MRYVYFTRLFTAGVTALLFLVNCSNPTSDDHAGNSSQTGNAIVSGHLYKAGGPAIGARVFFVPVNHNPNPAPLPKIFAATDTVITDSTGLYGTNDLDSGTYNVFGAGTDGNLSLIDSVHVTGDSQVVPPDTLKLPGLLTGTIKMQGRDDPASVLIMPFGTFIKPDPTPSTGAFSLSNLAEGWYSIRFMSVLDRYEKLDTTFEIKAGQPLVLDSIVLPLKIPTPTGFKISYDTLKQIVTLSWDKMDTARVKGYNMYRQHLGRADSLLTPLAIADTFYVDSTGIQDQTYSYSVVAVDFENKEGIRTPGDTVQITPLYSFVRGWGSIQPSDSQFWGPYSMTKDSKGNLFIADAGFNKIVEYDTVGNLLLTIGSNGTDSGKFQQPWDVEVDANDHIFVADYGNGRIQRFDLTGHANLIINCDSSDIGFVAKPRYLQIDSSSNIYALVFRGGNVADFPYQALAVYDSTGAFKSSTNIAALIQNKLAQDFLIHKGSIYISAASDLYTFTMSLSALSHIPNVRYPMTIAMDSLLYCGGSNITGFYKDGPIKIMDLSGSLIGRFGKRPDYTAAQTTWTSTTDASLCGLVVDAKFDIYTLESSGTLYAVKKFKLN